MAGTLAFDFEQYRGFLFGLGYRLLGSAADAEDLVQDTYVRAAIAADREPVASPRTYLATIATRLGLDRLKSARARREEYPGPWLPEPLPAHSVALAQQPEDAVAMEDSISLAFMVMLESLTPPERAAFILHEAFAFEHREIAAILEISDAASRQHVHRAKQHLAARKQRFAASSELRERLTGAFLLAVREGDIDAILALLADDVTAWSDGGGKVTSALNPIYGADRVSRFLAGVAGRTPVDDVAVLPVNGVPGIVLKWRGRVQSITVFEPDTSGRIAEIRIIGNPDKTRGFLRPRE